MRQFETSRIVSHSAEDMFNLVGDIECYPDFVPLCSKLRIIDETIDGDILVKIADMSVAFKALSETFRCKVTEDRAANEIVVEYLDGPFRSLRNVWTFTDTDPGKSKVHFFIAYEFKSRMLQMVAGSVFDRAFSKFSDAFESRADEIYGIDTPSA
ncbi:MAG: type II toxin-antitoxin system RatA family toxin [Rhizobiales bacterium]|nr:type II toxin-antitoxin system RatA family toxin [Hyphomicrobiales bacterium]